MADGKGARASGKQKAALGTAAAIGLILSAIFAVEGGYVDDPNDPGGKTNHGITEREARAGGFTGRMQDLTRQDAKRILGDKFVSRPGFVAIVERSFDLAHETIDTGVNTGTYRASLWFQQSLNHFNNRGRDYPDIAEDGQIGPATMAAYDALRRKRGSKLACELMIKAMDAKQAEHYMRLAGTNSKFETFMTGWFRTRIGNVDFRECA